jgi:uncharacterized alkaline shock family protein YloU
VSDEVVEKIAGNAAREVPGVADLGGDVVRFFAPVKERVGLGDLGDDAGRGVSGKAENGTATINIVIEAGHAVSEVSEQVRARVVTALEQYGLQVAAVNVTVDDVELGGATPPASWPPRVPPPLSRSGTFCPGFSLSVQQEVFDRRIALSIVQECPLHSIRGSGTPRPAAEKPRRAAG